MYEYRCELVRVLDGDTIWVDVDLGFDVHMKDTIRLAHINAPELRTTEGDLAKAALAEMLSHGPLLLKTIKDRKEKYGRYLGIITNGNGVNVNDQMVKEGHAETYVMASAEPEET